MSYSSNLNPDVVKTELDDVFDQEWNASTHPGYVDATSGSIFKQLSSDMAAEQEEVFKGVSLWDERDEEEVVGSENPLITNKQTFSMIEFAKKINIPKRFFDDNMHGSYEKMVRDFGRKARATRDDKAIALYRNAFTTTLNADGVAFISDSHVTIGGGTVDNKLTTALAVSSLEDAIVKLVEQKDQANVIMGNMPDTLFVPIALFKTATEITDSVLLADTTDNNVNWISSKYGIKVVTSNRLGSAAGGSDTAWFLLSSNHAVNRWEREAINTNLIDWRYQDNNTYVYKGHFREAVGVIDYSGVVGSLGTA